jgi:thioredoxin-dependent peroxiredoxin
MKIKIGDTAPDFSLQDDNGKTVTLAQYLGKPVVLYFYPKDDTPGCTTEACNFRDDYSAYQKAGVTILGISPDNEKSHTGFKLKYNLPYTLLSDPDHLTCLAYDSWGLKKYAGREYDGVLRNTFLIGADGKIIKIFENVKPAEHSREVLEALSQI